MQALRSLLSKKSLRRVISRLFFVAEVACFPVWKENGWCLSYYVYVAGSSH